MNLTSNIRSQIKSVLLSALGRMLVGYLIYKIVSFARAEDLALGARHELADNADGHVMDPDICSSETIDRFLRGQLFERVERGEMARLLYLHCSEDFLSQYFLEPQLRLTVDEYLGLELGQASEQELLDIYKTMLVKPPKVDESVKLDKQFDELCQQTNENYEKFVDKIAPLATLINLVPANQEQRLNENERALLNYSLYSFVCKSMMNSEEL